jgi:hypothetical protein
MLLHLRIFLIAVLVLGIGVNSLAELPTWVNIGLQGEPITGLDSFYGHLYARTNDGFHSFDRWTRTWTAYTEPGIPGRAVSVVVEHLQLPEVVVTGRVDGSGHCYIELNSLDGQDSEIVYQSQASRISAIKLDEVDQTLWATTLAGDEPGELLHSLDGGSTWTTVAVPGMTSFTDVAIVGDFSEPLFLFVAGDSGIAVSPDNGASWENFSSGLPAGAVNDLTSLVYFGPTLKNPENSLPDLIASTDEGLYASPMGYPDWQLVLAEPCTDSDGFSLHSGGVLILALTADNRLFYNYLISWLPWAWTEWTDSVPTESSIVDAIYPGGVAFVATDEGGVFESPGVWADVPEVMVDLAVSAAPNPFNPRTTFHLSIPGPGHCQLQVYDVSGKLVDSLLEETVQAGDRWVTWEPTNLASGVYLVRFSMGNREAIQRVVLAK